MCLSIYFIFFPFKAWPKTEFSNIKSYISKSMYEFKWSKSSKLDPIEQRIHCIFNSWYYNLLSVNLIIILTVFCNSILFSSSFRLQCKHSNSCLIILTKSNGSSDFRTRISFIWLLILHIFIYLFFYISRLFLIWDKYLESAI